MKKRLIILMVGGGVLIPPLGNLHPYGSDGPIAEPKPFAEGAQWTLVVEIPLHQIQIPGEPDPSCRALVLLLAGQEAPCAAGDQLLVEGDQDPWCRLGEG